MYFTKSDLLTIYNYLLLYSTKDSELEKTDKVCEEDFVAIIQNGKNRRIDLETLFNYILENRYIENLQANNIDSKSITTDKLVIDSDNLILSDQSKTIFDIIEEIVLRNTFKHKVLYSNEWDDLLDSNKEADVMYFVLEEDSPLPILPEGELVNIIFDFNEFENKVTSDYNYNGLNIINNNNSNADYIDKDGIHWSLTSKNNARYLTYTPENDGMIKVYFSAYNNNIDNAIAAISKGAMVIGSDIKKLLVNTRILNAALTNGIEQKEFSANVKAGDTIYIYGANKGINILRIEFSYKKKQELPDVPTDNSFVFRNNTLIGDITFSGNTAKLDCEFKENSFVVDFENN